MLQGDLLGGRANAIRPIPVTGASVHDLFKFELAAAPVCLVNQIVCAKYVL
jgi:hypothetical protein